jgi:dTDP-4-dehydrorhamnose 3,5-epimerase
VRFKPTPLPEVLVIELERARDERGWFARTFDGAELAEVGIEMAIVQASVSFNPRAGTLRGLHYQAEPHAEQKIVRCTRGAIFDVAVDVREDSTTRGRWFGIELAADEPSMLYVPPGFAHGFQTLGDDSEVSYLIAPEYAPEAFRGVRWDDPSIAIDWPEAERTVSERDRGLPLLES